MAPLPQRAAAATAGSILASIQSLDRQLRAQPDVPAWTSAKPEIANSIARALAAAEGDREFLALEELARARILYGVADWMQQGQSTIAKGMPGFESEWRRASLDFAAAELAARNEPWLQQPLALRALAEAAQGKAQTLLDAGRAMAQVEGAEAGMYYLGQARASVEFAAFCRGLDGLRSGVRSGVRSGEPPALPPLQPALERLQARALAAFRPPLSIDRHPDFIQFNATLKFAGELSTAGFVAGAWYKYLDALHQFGRIAAATAPTPGAIAENRVRQTLRDLRARLSTASGDSSLAEIFLERAEAALKTTPSPTADDWLNAAILAEQVLPTYFETSRSQPAVQVAAKDPVTVTLVRWPYT
jgi:hypothetical protein